MFKHLVNSFLMGAFLLLMGCGRAPTSEAGVDRLDAGLMPVTLSLPDETVVAVARGGNGTAIVWREDERLRLWWDGVVVGEMAGGGTADLLFDDEGDLHLVYGAGREMVYQRWRGGVREMVAVESLGQGENLMLVLDRTGGVCLFFDGRNGVYERCLQDAVWDAGRLVGRGRLAGATGTGDGAAVWVRQAETVVVYVRDGEGVSARHKSFEMDRVGAPVGVARDGDVLVAAWVAFEPRVVASQRWLRQRPYYGAAEGEDAAYEGGQGQTVFSVDGRHLAGVYQRIETTAGAVVSASAWGRALACDGCEGVLMNGAICLDKRGGVDVLAQGVVCSTRGDFLTGWDQVAVTAVSEGGWVTLFLRAAPDVPRPMNGMVWDQVEVEGGDVVDGGFEGGVVISADDYVGADLNEGWRPFFVTDEFVPQGVGLYQVFVTRSLDGGVSWETPLVVFDNGGRGGIDEVVSPVVKGSRLALFYVAEVGEVDWTDRAGRVRYGRPQVVVCGFEEEGLTCGAKIDLVGRERLRPVVNLRVDDGGGTEYQKDVVVVWDAYQGSYGANKDLFVMGVRPWFWFEGAAHE